MVKQPSMLSLDGSTFGALRIVPGTIGAALPDPVVVCPAPVDVDAGVPDAGTPDGGSPVDASPPDAMM
jgi:hypothetical protein